MGSVGGLLLATAVLLFVQIVATTTKEAMGAEDYVRPAMPDVGVGVARPSMRCADVGGRTVRQKRGSTTMLMVGAVVLSNGAEMLMWATSWCSCITWGTW